MVLLAVFFFCKLQNKQVCTVCRNCISTVWTKHYLNLHDRKVWDLAGNVQLKIKSLFMEPSFLIFTKIECYLYQSIPDLSNLHEFSRGTLSQKYNSSQEKRNVIIYILQHINTGRQDLCCLWFQLVTFLVLWELPPRGSSVTYISVGSDKRLFSNRSLPLQAWFCWLSLRYLGKCFWYRFSQ